MPRYNFILNEHSSGILHDVQSKLEKALNETDAKVISISGPWGSGKTHSVDKTLKEIRESRRIRIARASLFGVRTIAELKLALLDSIASSAGGIRSSIQKKLGWARNDLPAVLGKVHTLGPLANEMVMLWSTRALAGHLIVLDDIERKHDQLEMSELSGFIENFKLNHGARFILVMNDEKLADVSEWREVHEKIIDREINLRPRPSDSLAVAMATESKLKSALDPLLAGCGITNIRVIKRIITEANRGLPAEVSPDSATARLFLAPLVFILGTHLRARAGQSTTHTSFRLEMDGELVLDAESEKAAENIGIQRRHALTACVIELIHSGALPQDRVRQILSQEFSNEDQHALSEEIRSISNDYDWDPDWTDSASHAAAATAALSAARHLNHQLLSRALHMLEHIGSPPETMKEALLEYGRTTRSITSRDLKRISKDEAERLHEKLKSQLQEEGLVDHAPKKEADQNSYDPDLYRMSIIGTFGYSSATDQQSAEWFAAQLEKVNSEELRSYVVDLLDRGGSPSLAEEHVSYARAFSDACRLFISSTQHRRRARMVQLALEGNRPMR
ncbi:P-loop NTPase fold protein [Stenotrophomonas sp. ZAC14D2_NAIMI4_6]|uniref:P-loop NTPase fold protein n=1 Tax=Stenotrophomonas sp. ZAC14D2_NAIMI4_6 TaxID=2072406 RepID=UPI000D53F0F3|nr:P-loop NTPase fold protein [Stenotrophomonas sp. ZAC14D2_NAIMI4_6]AWH21710.1 hypothetical protein C1933_11045 [Stenotrophomonas sp. ZAC14D2_NAIMI4_6]